MNSYSDLDRMRGSVDELALKKQLPLRQQADKPILKYDTSLTKPVQLFNHVDVASQKPPGSAPGVRSQRNEGQPQVVSGNSSSASSTSSVCQNGSAKGASQSVALQGHRKSRGSSIRHMASSPANGVENPYSRPISAKEVIEDVQRSRWLAGSTGTGMPGPSMVHASSTSASSKVQDHSSTLQLNSFMRPQSTVQSDTGTTSATHKTSKITSRSSTNASTKPVAEKTEVGVQEQKFEEALKRQMVAVVPERAGTINPAKTPLRPLNGQTSSAGGGEPGLSRNPSVRNPNYTPTKPYSEVSKPVVKDSVATVSSAPSHNSTSDMSEHSPVTVTVSGGKRQHPVPVSSKTTKPSVGPLQLHTNNLAAMAAQRGAKHAGSKTSEVVPLKESLSGLAGVEESGLPLHNLTASSLLSTRMGHLRKMPVTHTLTGTLYYRKCFKDTQTNMETHYQGATGQHSQATSDYGHQRPGAEGAPARTGQALPEDKLLQDKQKLLKTVQPEKAIRAVKSEKDIKSLDTGKATKADFLENGTDLDPSGKPTKTAQQTTKAVKSVLSEKSKPAASGKVVRNGQLDKLSKPTQDGDLEEEDDDDVSTPSGERLPGDGEASCEEPLDDDEDDAQDDVDDDDDDDGIDDLYDDQDDDGDSDDYTVCSSASAGSSAMRVRMRSATSRPSTSQSACNRPAAAGEDRAKSFIRPITASGEATVLPALRPSLFAAIPPTVNFVIEGEKVEQLPWEMRRLLKWRMSPITPNIVKVALNRVGFRITKKSHDWIGCFGKHMKANGFKGIREYQKLNHFPGSFQLGRKDRLWRNLSRLQVSFGKKEFGFFPQTYVLPQDLKLLKRAFEDGNNKQKWIIKPPASARGIGIKVIHRWNQIPRRRPVIVQKYLARPLLINDSKFDLRVYVYVTCYDPLRAYVFEDGLARFASCKYSSNMKHLNNKFMHLTNYSINKRNAEYQSNTDDSVCQGHKWSLKSLWMHLKKQGINTAAIWDSIKDLAVKTLISAEGPINSMVKSNVRSRYVVHELFGFDVLLDEQYRPWILEVNISPSLHSNSQLDINIKGQMIRDMLNLAGYRLPDKNDIYHYAHQSGSVSDLSSACPTPSCEVSTKTAGTPEKPEKSEEPHDSSVNVPEKPPGNVLKLPDICAKAVGANPVKAFEVSLKYPENSSKAPEKADNIPEKCGEVPDGKIETADGSSPCSCSAHIPSSDYCMDKRLFTNQLAPDERSKHAYFCHRHQDEQVLQTILDTLTPDDVRILTESIDEDSRKGGFIRVFPTPSTHKYLRYFEAPRYYNLLLDQWVQRYNRMEMRGIALLQSLCEEGFHLDNPNESGRRKQWAPPNSTAILSAREGRPPPAQVVRGKDGVVGVSKSSPAQSRLPGVMRPSASCGSLGAITTTPAPTPSAASTNSTPHGPASRSPANVPDPNR